MVKPEADYLFEVSWEVCNKVGGIFTVIKSKAHLINHAYGNYFLIGPYFEQNAKLFLKPARAPDAFKKVFDELAKENINCFFGKWATEGEPYTILVDFRNYIAAKNDIKKKYWDDWKIDSLKSGWDFEEPMVWAFCAGKLIEKISKEIGKAKAVAHFHEWLAGLALLYIKKQNVKIATVFHTHATMLGRTISGAGQNLFAMLGNINPEEEAYKYGIQEKFQTEKACANSAEVFSTVSEITSIEAEKLLGRKPDVLLLNGIEHDSLPTFEETSFKHKINKEIVKEFLEYYFFPYYSFDLDNTLIYFIIGRYEFRNKGIDVFIKALARLNEMMKREKSEKTICAFLWIPAANRGLRRDVLENKNYYRHIKSSIEQDADDIKRSLVETVVSGRQLTLQGIFSEEALQDFKRSSLLFKKGGNPPLVTHNLENEGNDIILNTLKASGLDNSEAQRVKMIYYPVYLDGNDGMLYLPYYDAITGCHLGVFPSVYEPWGYTPLECGSLGVAAVTSDLAGFGRFIKGKITKTDRKGIFVIDMMNRSEEQITADLVKVMHDYSLLNREERIENKYEAKQLAELADWKILINYYYEAHNLALQRLK